jgi:pimeloyl-ACP methyl ester carboxylesterase
MRNTVPAHAVDVHTIQLQDLRVSVQRTGVGEPMLLLHGFPHTKELWREVTPLLVAAGFQVLAPDLRGIGGSEVTEAGYDAITLAEDQVQLLDALSLETAHVVGFDLGAAPAFALAASQPARVMSVTIIEAVIGGLPGADAFLGSGGPWWFSFHQTPGGLAEDVVTGAEDRYVRYFLELGSRRGVPEDLTREFIDSYTSRSRLRAAFEHYRAMPSNSEWNRIWAERGTLTMPVAAIGASPVGDVTARQLERVSTDFTGHLLGDIGHIVPIDAPSDVARIVIDTAVRTEGAR